MIVGAGNAYVAEAKRQLFGRVGIDLLAGPTEMLVIADATADPELVPPTCSARPSTGRPRPAVLVTTSRELGAAVLGEIERLLRDVADEPRSPARVARPRRGRRRGDRDGRSRLAERLRARAPRGARRRGELDCYLAGLRNYGSLFLGEQATVVFGDKAVGTNHVLPTAGAARYTGGLWVGKFLKTLTYQRLTEEGTRQVAPAAAAISEAELFAGHALTARMRLERSGASA